MTQTAVIQDLQSRLQAIIRIAKQEIQPLDKGDLNWKTAPDSWSVLECLEHLNRYFRFYNPQLEKHIAKAAPAKKTTEYTSAWLGKQVIQLIDPQNVKKSKTLTRYNPTNSQLDRTVIDEFLQHLQRVQRLLSKAETVDFSQKKIPVEFFKLLKLQIGDTFIFLIYHAQRHLNQALNVKKALPKQVMQ